MFVLHTACRGVYVFVCALTVVCGIGLLKAEGASPFAKTGESSCISPRLSKTLETGEKMSCFVTDQNQGEI